MLLEVHRPGLGLPSGVGTRPQPVPGLPTGTCQGAHWALTPPSTQNLLSPAAGLGALSPSQAQPQGGCHTGQGTRVCAGRGCGGTIPLVWPAGRFRFPGLRPGSGTRSYQRHCPNNGRTHAYLPGLCVVCPAPARAPGPGDKKAIHWHGPPSGVCGRRWGPRPPGRRPQQKGPRTGVPVPLMAQSCSSHQRCWTWGSMGLTHHTHQLLATPRPTGISSACIAICLSMCTHAHVCAWGTCMTGNHRQIHLHGRGLQAVPGKLEGKVTTGGPFLSTFLAAGDTQPSAGPHPDTPVKVGRAEAGSPELGPWPTSHLRARTQLFPPPPGFTNRKLGRDTAGGSRLPTPSRAGDKGFALWVQCPPPHT